ncbi:MAG TPA: formylmethanofuran dehydrogenase subunit C [Methanocellales archaeon]|nr:formylmethanofuran dehydrogenase subunit C [Methanocellales archaeon]
MLVKLTPKEAFNIPVEAEIIKPDNFAGKGKSEIESIIVWHGNKEVMLGSLFDVEVEGVDDKDKKKIKILIEGDASRIKRIGERMTSGEIVINGSVDMHCGALMSGGKIIINGDADAWAGREMRGGEIVVEGNAGNYLGAGYWGAEKGMRGGLVRVKGSAGNYVGEHMRGGEIIIGGSVGLLPGLNMSGGKITIEGDAVLPGGEMKSGTLVVKGKVLEMLPSFRFEGTEVLDSIELKKFTGDLTRGGSGTLYVNSIPEESR